MPHMMRARAALVDRLTEPLRLFCTGFPRSRTSSVRRTDPCRHRWRRSPDEEDPAWSQHSSRSRPLPRSPPGRRQRRPVRPRPARPSWRRSGAADFKSLYAPTGAAASAMGKCVSKHVAAQRPTGRTPRRPVRRSARCRRTLQGGQRRQDVRREVRQEHERPQRLREVRLREGLREERQAGGGDVEGLEGVQDGAWHRRRLEGGVHREVRRQGRAAFGKCVSAASKTTHG